MRQDNHNATQLARSNLWKRHLLIAVCLPLLFVCLLVLLLVPVNLFYSGNAHSYSTAVTLLGAMIFPIIFVASCYFGVVGIFGFLKHKNTPVISENSCRIDDGKAYAGFWRRTLAALIDCFLVNVPALVLALAVEIVAVSFWHVSKLQAEELFSQTYLVLLIFLPWLYFAGFEASRFQATVGKIACGVVVADKNGIRLNFMRATGRYWAKLLSVATLFIGFLMCTATVRRQALHDFLAGSVVIKRISRVSFRACWGFLWRGLALGWVASQLSGCMTYGLYSVAGETLSRVESKDVSWSRVRIDSAYISSGDDLLVHFRGRAPHGLFSRRFHSVYPLGAMQAEVRTGYIERLETVDAESHVKEADVLAGVRFMNFRRTVRYEAIRGGWQRPRALAAAGWVELPVVKLEEAPMVSCTWHGLSALSPPPASEVGVLYYPVFESASGSFAVTLPEPVLGYNHSLAFVLEDYSPLPLRYLSIYVPVVALTPVTVAADIITLPIQGLVVIYVLHDISKSFL